MNAMTKYDRTLSRRKPETLTWRWFYAMRFALEKQSYALKGEAQAKCWDRAVDAGNRASARGRASIGRQVLNLRLRDIYSHPRFDIDGELVD